MLDSTTSVLGRLRLHDVLKDSPEDILHSAVLVVTSDSERTCEEGMHFGASSTITSIGIVFVDTSSSWKPGDMFISVSMMI